MNKRIAELLLRYAQRTISKSESLELTQWIDEDASNKLLTEQFLRYYKCHSQIEFLNQVSLERAWEKMQTKRARLRHMRTVRRVAYAASVALIVGVSALLYNSTERLNQQMGTLAEVMPEPGTRKATLILGDNSRIELGNEGNKIIAPDSDVTIVDSASHLSYQSGSKVISSEVLYNEIVVPRGGEYSLTLSDGTVVYLNSETRLRFPQKFPPNIRRLELEGEAYFQVARNEKSPFVVTTGGVEVRVLGTMFNISAYGNSDKIYTTLVEGSVEVSTQTKSMILTPDQQAQIIRTQENIAVADVDSRKYISWVSGIIEFKNTPLSEIMTQISRWYDVDVEYADSQFRYLRFAGAVDRHKSLDIALQALSKISDLKFEFETGRIMVK